MDSAFSSDTPLNLPNILGKFRGETFGLCIIIEISNEIIGMHGKCFSRGSYFGNEGFNDTSKFFYSEPFVLLRPYWRIF